MTDQPWRRRLPPIRIGLRSLLRRMGITWSQRRMAVSFTPPPTREPFGLPPLPPPRIGYPWPAPPMEPKSWPQFLPVCFTLQLIREQPGTRRLRVERGRIGNLWPLRRTEPASRQPALTHRVTSPQVEASPGPP